MLYIPYKDLDVISSNDDLVSIGFDKVSFKENNDKSVYFEFSFQEETIYRRIRKKDIIAVTINKNGSIRGIGAKSNREWILRAYEWYKIAKRETITNLSEDFIDSLIFDPQS